MDDNSLCGSIEKLERLYSTFNQHFFGGELQKVTIAVSPNRTRRAPYLGWFTTWKAWRHRDGSEGYYEINMCAEYLARPFEEICETLIHEMVHLLNLQKNTQDCSRGGTYHNKRFKEAAERHGLTVRKDERYGWAFTELNEETAQWLQTAFPGEEGFGLYRDNGLRSASTDEEDENPPVAPAKSSAKRYCCPGCGTVIRATKEVRVICADCERIFEQSFSFDCFSKHP